MKDFIKILIFLCFAHCIPTITMEQAEEEPNQLIEDGENLIDKLPNELLVMILSYVYFDESICNEYQNLSEMLKKLSTIFNIRIVCRRFDSLNDPNKLKEFYKSLLRQKLPKNLENTEVGKFIKAGNDKGTIADTIDNSYFYSCLGWPISKIIGLLLFYGANVNSQNRSGNTAIHESIKCLLFSNDLRNEVITILLAHNADVNIQNNNGFTALHLATYMHSTNEAKNNLIETIKILLDYKADVNIKTNLESTALHMAIYCYHISRSKNLEVIKLLLDHGADCTITNMASKTPIDLAEKSSSNELKELLGCTDKSIKNETNEKTDKSWNCILM